MPIWNLQIIYFTGLIKLKNIKHESTFNKNRDNLKNDPEKLKYKQDDSKSYKIYLKYLTKKLNIYINFRIFYNRRTKIN